MIKIRAPRSVSTAGVVLEALDGDGTGWSWRCSMVMDSVGVDQCAGWN